MIFQHKPVERRRFVTGALTAAVLAPLGGALSSCAASNDEPTKGPVGTVSATNPFGLAEASTIDAVIFNGGYGTDYVDYAAKLLEKNHPGTTTKISPSTNIGQELQPRFVGGNPPDIIDNTGKAMVIPRILSQLEDLNEVVNAKNLEGEVIKDTLYPGVLARDTYDGKLAAINYSLTVFALWHSASLFAKNGWTLPKTWDEMLSLGEKAKAQGKYLFVWGKEAATYYLEMVLTSVIKEGGDEIRLALENLEENCWSHPAVQGVLSAMDEIIKSGYVKPGGSGTQFTAAQAQWSNDQAAIFYPSGSWIENEMKAQTKPGFELTGAPIPTVTTQSKLPYQAIHSTATEAYIIPSDGKNPAGGKELLRTMLSKEAAKNFAKTKLASTIVKGTVPADGFGSTALLSQMKMLDSAGNDVFTWGFVDVYGMSKDMGVVWNTFLEGGADVASLTSQMQQITDKVRNDSSITKVKVR